MKTYHDLETYSTVPITHGTHAYAEKAEVLLWAYAIEDGPVKVWDLTQKTEMPLDLQKIVLSDAEMWWHNGGMFDRVVLSHALRYIHDKIDATRWRDTMVQAFCHSLPGALGVLSEAFKLGDDVAKDKRGKQLIQMFCKPQANGTRKTRFTHYDEWQEFIDYAKSDIKAMRALHKKMPTWNYPDNKFELSLWHLDQEINMRGIYVDEILARSAINAVEAAQKSLATATVRLTDGEVTAATQRDKMLAFILATHGVQLPDMQKSTLERRLEDPDLPQPVRDLLSLRLQSSTSSTAKYKKLLNCVSSDGRVRGTLQFAGAGRTQRWSGRNIQIQNFPRSTIDDDEIEEGIAAFKAGCADLITDNVPKLASNCLRGLFIAPPGKKLVVTDLSNIEGRAAAYLAGEHWKIQAFSDFDNGVGPDLYKMAYAKAFRVAVETVTKDQRQLGKIMELALGYGGGVGAFVTFATSYNIDLEALAESTMPNLPSDVVVEAANMWQWSLDTKRSTLGLSREAFVVCDALKRVWRRAHPAISAMWPALELAAKKAIENKGAPYPVGGHIAFERDGAWLKMLLPSGDCLSYPSPKIEDGITYMGMNQYSRKWQRISTYGGKLFENLCQKFARNIMAHNMHAIQNAGYDICATVHDEIITEADDTPGHSIYALSALLATPPAWASTIPLAAAGFEAYRYKK